MERWFVKREELVLGPYSEEELQGYVARGKVTAADLVSRDGKVGWTTIYQVPQFRDVATRDAATRLAAPPPEPESETPPAASVRAWYVARGSQVAGPLDLDALRAALVQGKLKLDDKVCEVGGTAWGAVNGIAEVADLLPPAIDPPSRTQDAPAHQQSTTTATDRPFAPTLWGEFESVVVAAPLRTRSEMEAGLRERLARLEGIPSDFAAAAKFDLHWVWLPAIVASGTFDGVWKGNATPYRDVERITPRGQTRREREYGFAQSFDGSITELSVITVVSGDPVLTPDVLFPNDTKEKLELVTAAFRERIMFDNISEVQLSALPALPEPATMGELRATSADACARLEEVATNEARSLASRSLRSHTSGRWDQHSVNVEITPSETIEPVLILLPALVGTYSYGDWKGRTAILATLDYAGHEGAPESKARIASRAALSLLQKTMTTVIILVIGAEILQFCGVIERGRLPWSSLPPTVPNVSMPTVTEMVTRCEQGEVTKCVEAGRAFFRGRGVRHDLARALQLFQRACDADSPPGCSALGALYHQGVAVPRDYVRAVALFRGACDRRDLLGCANLGMMMENGFGVPRSVSGALRLNQRACSGGTMRGCVNLGNMYARGVGVPRDSARAVREYARACEGNEAIGCIQLARMYEDGDGVMADPNHALRLYQQVCNEHETEGCLSLANFYASGRSGAPDGPRAITILQSLCDRGWPDGCREIASLYWHGRGVEVDRPRALALLRHACATGDEWSCQQVRVIAAAQAQQ